MFGQTKIVGLVKNEIFFQWELAGLMFLDKWGTFHVASCLASS